MDATRSDQDLNLQQGTTSLIQCIANGLDLLVASLEIEPLSVILLGSFKL